ncbi:hypothetical protein [Halorientalis regularis]|uniref:DUF8173 domain-containing protein n=1 Tax=Halorientalis regularis TaxID=660518 RepID=A0A1G7N1D9_9EURY|nr:hypothetical protein [Halorientalis regularis]SDF67868.1 hypothetical protein SAMN05216218_108147 [Halorientalis regularis]
MIDIVSVVGWVLLQFGDVGSGPGVNVNVDPAAGVASSALGAFVLTVVVGAIMVAIAPKYTESKMDTLGDEPVGSFVYGVLMLVLSVILFVALLFSLIGIPVAIVLFFALLLVWGVGSAIAFLTIATRLIEADDGWLKPLLVAGALNGGLTLTGIGGLVAFCIGAAGFGAILRDCL